MSSVSIPGSANPVALGQTRFAFYVSAALVLIWFLSRISQASAVPISGWSEDEYIRLEWLYDLEEGHGIITLKNHNHASDGLIAAKLGMLHFPTIGMKFDSVSGSLGRYLDEPMVSATAGPLLYYRYCSTPQTSVVIPTVDPPAAIVANFPTKGVQLTECRFYYHAYLAHVASAAFPCDLVSNYLDFVSIQAIPEPDTAALLLGAVAAGTATATRRRSWLCPQSEENM